MVVAKASICQDVYPTKASKSIAGRPIAWREDVHVSIHIALGCTFTSNLLHLLYGWNSLLLHIWIYVRPAVWWVLSSICFTDQSYGYVDLRRLDITYRVSQILGDVTCLYCMMDELWLSLNPEWPCAEIKLRITSRAQRTHFIWTYGTKHTDIFVFGPTNTC